MAIFNSYVKLPEGKTSRAVASIVVEVTWFWCIPGPQLNPYGCLLGWWTALTSDGTWQEI